ncbi:universal stress protein [Nostocoides sp. F2B08]|uniref:universal stress protein n=1 Tax=Nostocoides sp. F2B08 TaxID=2653936 RepID=UPI001262D8D2|nr:universal stress protein [Tetrasphaera sp. F2B08]KAB7745175.1 universal stress protein [Tetrasphaera sp. F2B08]
MAQTVLVGVDHGDASTRAVEFATDRAQRNGWEILLVHVINWSPYSMNTPSENEERHRQRQREIDHAMEHVIAPMRAIVEHGGVPVRTEVRHGKPSDTLIDLAEDNDVVHIIVGRLGDSGLREAIFGSVASRLVQHANVPVTVVP